MKDDLEAAALCFFAALAYAVASGAALSAFGQTTFSDGLFSASAWLIPVGAVVLPLLSVGVYVALTRIAGSSPVASLLSATGSATVVGLCHALTHGWDWPYLVFVAIPIQAILLGSFVWTRRVWVPVIAATAFELALLAMRSVPM